MPNRIAHFEIYADDVERAANFYRAVFDWTISKWESPEMEYWMVMTGPKEDTTSGINGGLVKRQGVFAAGAANAFVCTAVVDDFEVIAEKILAAGGKVAMPKFEIAGMAWQGYFLDTDGTTFGVRQVIKKESEMA